MSEAIGTKAGQAFLTGKVEVSRRYNGQTFTRLVLPAEDEYSRPQTVEVVSQGPIGARGDVFKGWCRVGGYPRRYTTGDGETVQTAQNTLEFVE